MCSDQTKNLEGKSWSLHRTAFQSAFTVTITSHWSRSRLTSICPLSSTKRTISRSRDRSTTRTRRRRRFCSRLSVLSVTATGSGGGLRRIGGGEGGGASLRGSRDIHSKPWYGCIVVAGECGNLIRRLKDKIKSSSFEDNARMQMSSSGPPSVLLGRILFVSCWPRRLLYKVHTQLCSAPPIYLGSESRRNAICDRSASHGGARRPCRQRRDLTMPVRRPRRLP